MAVQVTLKEKGLKGKNLTRKFDDANSWGTDKLDRNGNLVVNGELQIRKDVRVDTTTTSTVLCTFAQGEWSSVEVVA